MQREDLTVNLTVDLFLKSRCLHLPSYPCGFRLESAARWRAFPFRLESNRLYARTEFSLATCEEEYFAEDAFRARRITSLHEAMSSRCWECRCSESLLDDDHGED